MNQSSRRYVVAGLVWASVAVLLVMWLLGVAFNVGGPLINVLLLLAGIGIEYDCRPVAGRSRNSGNESRQGSSGTSRSEEKMAA
jgi:Family of unknown function (DUF5670)